MNVSRVLKFFLDSLRDDQKPIEILRFYCYNINYNLSEVRKVGVAPHTPLGAPLWCMLSAGLSFGAPPDLSFFHGRLVAQPYAGI